MAQAQAPVVVGVEVSGGEADAAAIRGRLSEALRVPMLSPFEPGGAAARGTLTIGMDYERGTARVQYRTSDGMLVWSTVETPAEADAEGLWVVDRAAALVREAERRLEPMRLTSCLEVIDPWRHQGRVRFDSSFFQLPSEVLNPFDGPGLDARQMADYRLPPEVIDPWDPVFRGSTGRSRAAGGGGTGSAEGARDLAPPPATDD